MSCFYDIEHANTAKEVIPILHQRCNKTTPDTQGDEYRSNSSRRINISTNQRQKKEKLELGEGGELRNDIYSKKIQFNGTEICQAAPARPSDKFHLNSGYSD
jgi:hypothetical protein